MTKATACILKGREIEVDKALLLRDEARQTGDPDPDSKCGECYEPVRPHKGSGYGRAHIEHWERNPNCSRSDPDR